MFICFEIKGKGIKANEGKKAVNFCVCEFDLRTKRQAKNNINMLTTNHVPAARDSADSQKILELNFSNASNSGDADKQSVVHAKEITPIDHTIRIGTCALQRK